MDDDRKTSDEENPLFDSISQAEKAYGQDGYQANIEVTKSIAMFNRNHASLMQKKSEALGALAGAFPASLLLFGVPVAVWLWRWATGNL